MIEPKQDVNTILDYERQIEQHTVTLNDLTKQYTVLVDEMAELEREIAVVCLDYIHENEDGIKMVRAKLEMVASSKSSELRAKYSRLVYLRRRKKGAEMAIMAVEKSLSAIQSQMKFTKL